MENTQGNIIDIEFDNETRLRVRSVDGELSIKLLSGKNAVAAYVGPNRTGVVISDGPNSVGISPQGICLESNSGATTTWLTSAGVSCKSPDDEMVIPFASLATSKAGGALENILRRAADALAGN